MDTVPALVVLALVLAAAVPASAVATDPGSTPTSAVETGAAVTVPTDPETGPRDEQFAGQTAPPADTTVTRIALRADGDARWTVRIRTRLDSEGDVTDYERFQAEFRNDTARFLDPFAERMRAVVAAAAEATGREMTARNFSASTRIQEVPRRWGVVAFSFTWTAFAEEDGPGLVVGDAFEGGLFLAEGDSLVVEAPDGYVVRSVDPQPTDETGDAVTWEGRTDFADQRPRVVVAPAEGRTGQRSGPLGLATGTALGVAVAAGVALVAGAVLLRSPARRGAVLAALGGGLPGVGGEQSGAGAAADGEPPITVMTDGEQVEALLAEHGGRMKQADVVEALGWSESKTSRVVGDLVEEGRVEKLRLGRENVLDLSE